MGPKYALRDSVLGFLGATVISPDLDLRESGGKDGGGESREGDPELTGKSLQAGGEGVSLTGGLLAWGRGRESKRVEEEESAVPLTGYSLRPEAGLEHLP